MAASLKSNRLHFALFFFARIGDSQIEIVLQAVKSMGMIKIRKYDLRGKEEMERINNGEREFARQED